jgi:hypothetical protein
MVRNRFEVLMSVQEECCLINWRHIKEHLANSSQRFDSNKDKENEKMDDS